MNYRSALESMGYRVHQDGGRLRFPAMYRDGGNQNSISMYSDTGVWVDYGVGDDSYFPFIRLVELTVGKSHELYQQIDSEEGYIDDDKMLYKAEDQVIKQKLMETKKYPKDCLKKLLPHYSFYNDKGVKDGTLKFYRGGLSMSDNAMSRRFVFPCYSEDGDIIGFAGRTVVENDTRLKWKIIGGKKNFIYPAFNESLRASGHYPVQKKIEETNEVHLLESVGDSLIMSQNGELNNLVAFGVAASDKLKSFLSRFPDLMIFVCTNNDDHKSTNSGLVGAIKMTLQLWESFDYDKVKICLPTRNDFGEMDEDDFRDWRSKKEKVKTIDQKAFVIKEARKMIEEKTIPKKYEQLIKKIEKST